MKVFYIILLIATPIFGFSQEDNDRGYIVQIGETAPDFEMTFTNSEKSKLSDYRGKTVMLQFTASWCKVCREEMPYIEREIWQKNKTKDFIVIGIDRDEPLEVVVEFGKKMGVTYPLALDPNADIFGLFAHKKSGITRNVIIDKNGKIVFLTRLFKREEFNEMKDVIAELLKD